MRGKAWRDDLEGRIRDKDLLLKELQHRVKNNLQIITALIRLKSRSASSEASEGYQRRQPHRNSGPALSASGKGRAEP